MDGDKNGRARLPRIGGNEQGAVSMVAVIIVVGIAIALSMVAANSFLAFGRDMPEGQISGFQAALQHEGSPANGSARLLVMPVTGQPVVLGQAHLALEIDGNRTVVPLTAIASQTSDGQFWRAGETICVAGAGSDCLAPAGSHVRVQLIVKNQLVYEAVHPN